MRKLSLALLAALAITSLAMPALASDCARCVGATPCNACSTCEHCAHCSSGGTCGVCAPAAKPYAPPKAKPKARRSATRKTYSGGSASSRQTAPARKPTPDKKPKVKVVAVRLVAWTLPANGQQAQMVMIDLKNVGSVPVKTVRADITPYDASGQRLGSGAKNYTIFAGKTLAPGKTYVRPRGDGYVLLPAYGAAKRAVITITRVE